MITWRRPSGDRGLTLVETSVTMLILGFVSTAVMVLITGAQRMTAENDQRLDQINTGRVAIEAMSRNLRAAIMPSQLGLTCPSTDPTCAPAAFVSGTATSVQFYANVDNVDNAIGPSKISYVLSAGQLVERIQRPDPRPPGSTTFTYCTPAPTTCPVRERVVARGVQTSSPVFTYYTASGSPMTATTLTADDLSRVDSIEMSVTVANGAAGVKPTTFLQRVSLPNADTVVRTDGT